MPVARGFERRLRRVAVIAVAALLGVLASAAASRAAVNLLIDETGAGPGQELFTPYGIAWDAVGQRAIVTSYDNSLVFGISNGGGTPVIQVLMDDTGDGVNALEGPYGVAVASDGSIYVTGEISDNVFEIAPGGAITEIVDAGGAGPGKTILQPRGIAVGPDGTVYVAGFSTHNVLAVAPGGAITELIDAVGDGTSSLTYPIGLAVDGASNVYVSGYFSNNLFRITPGGVITELIDATGDGIGNTLDRPWDVAVNAAGGIVVAGNFSNNVLEYSPGGTIRQVLGPTGNGSTALVAPVGLAATPGGGMFVTSSITDTVFKIFPYQAPVIVAADPNGDGMGNLLIGPWAVASTDTGGVLVTGAFSTNAFQGDPPAPAPVPGLLVPAVALLGLGLAGTGARRLQGSRRR